MARASDPLSAWRCTPPAPQPVLRSTLLRDQETRLLLDPKAIGMQAGRHRGHCHCQGDGTRIELRHQFPWSRTRESAAFVGSKSSGVSCSLEQQSLCRPTSLRSAHRQSEGPGARGRTWREPWEAVKPGTRGVPIDVVGRACAAWYDCDRSIQTHTPTRQRQRRTLSHGEGQSSWASPKTGREQRAAGKLDVNRER